jgi:multisubunit Na+/H+ antiporter MnhF subunit
MKYSNTARVLSFLFHLILVLAFGCLGFYFGFFVVPVTFDGYNNMKFSNTLFAPSLSIELAVLGLTIFTISLYGLIQAFKGLKAPTDDKPVVKSFVAFIGDGYVASAFFAGCAFLYFDPIANKNLAFTIVMAVLFLIITLIATNIPMYRLFEGKESTDELAGLSFSAAVGFGFIALMNILALIGSLVYAKAAGGYSYSGNINAQLLTGALAGAIVCGLTTATGVIVKKKGSADKKAVTLSGYLTSGAIFAFGGGLLALGIMDLLWKENLCHFTSTDFKYIGLGYPVMNMVIGSLAIVGAVIFMIITARDSKKVEAKA